ncbi:peptidoglycan DD-metalloendopeptidase family protein [Streptomyces griseoluteus]|uniref:aggregation-promoting factor C-terminal-like domain-containing protein n=1 Tax=Streptomyces griseoluteus TaxID=29306 RepID=UPI003417ED29
MAADLDIVGTAAVDIVPVLPNFHDRLKARVLPSADRIGEDVGRRLGEAITRHVVVDIPDAVNAGGRRARVAATRQGADTGGAFGNAVRRKLEEAFRSLPKANVRLGDTGINADIDRLRARIETLSGKRIGLDIEAGAALREITEIDAALQRLASENPSVQVDAGTAAARAALAEVQHAINGVDRDDVHVRVHVDTAGALSALRGLGIALAAVSLIPVAPVAVAGLGAITSMALAAGAGVGALALAAVPAIKSVTGAIQAKSAAEREATSATKNSASSAASAAQRALTLAGAQAALASAHRQAAQSIAQANRQVEDAERAVAQAAQRAMQQREQSAQAVERAERSLTDAKRQALDAEQALTQARTDAAQQLESFNDRLIDGGLAQRDAALRTREALEELKQVQADPKATDIQIERAQLAYDQAKQAQTEGAKSFDQLQKDAAKAKKAGVDGNTGVKRAAEQLAQAQRNVGDQTRAVADAQREAARAQIAAAQGVADAQWSLSVAVENAANAQAQAADSVASAERGLQSARLSGASTAKQSAGAADSYRKALAALTPEQRDMYDALAGPRGLTKAFKDWSTSLQPDVLPLLTRGINAAKAALPGLTPLVRGAAEAVGILFDDASRELKTPFWQGFKRDIDTSAKPAILGLGRTVGNVLKGMAGTVDAFLPHIDDFADRMVKSSGRFANWGTSLKGSPAFERFLAYAGERGPLVAETLGSIAGAFLSIGGALSPIATPLLKVIGKTADGIASIADTLPWLIQLMYGFWVVTKLITIAQIAFNVAASMNPYVLIALAIIALVSLVIYAYKKWGWFHDAVNAAWDGIKKAALWAWDNVLKPVFSYIWDGLKQIGDVAVWLWQKVFVPVWNFISLAARVAAAIILTLVIAPLLIAFNALGAVGKWLWEKALKPAWNSIANAAVELWEKYLKPALQHIWDGVKWVGDKFVWLYDHAVKPAAGWVADKATWLYDKALKPVFDNVWRGLKWVGDKFGWLYDHAVKPVAGWIADKTGWLYDKGVKPAFDSIKSAVRLVAESFGKAKDAIRDAWYKVAGIAARPVNFVIKTVYTNGIKAVWDKVAGFVGLGKLPNAPKLLNESPKLLEAGGTVGNGWGVARPMVTNRPTAIVGEGNPRYPEYVIPTDPKYRARALSLHQAAGTQLLESGGILGGAIDWAKTAAGVLLDPAKVWKELTSGILSKVADGVGPSPMGKAVGKYPVRMVGGLKGMLVDAVQSMFAGGGGVGQWIKPVNVPYGTRFGVAGPMWSSGHHTGLDFPAPVGTPIKAVAGGTVASVGTAGPYGNHLEINHGGGLMSLYAHMSKILAGLGQVVGQGDVIGKVGATGNVTGPHLHLEARLNGKTVDPMPYLTSIRGGSKISSGIAAAKNFAKGQLRYFGWGPREFSPLEKLWEGESGWRYNATNPSSGAYGIPQALPASKMASAGPDWKTNAATQIQWGMDYIKHRPDYGSPSAAYAKWLSRSPHWYDEGGYLQPGLSLVANGTGRPEPVFTSGQWATLSAAKSGPTAVNNEVRVFVGDREITDIVRTEIHTHEGQVATDINNGRWVS